jgi:PH (Pleckstrin Homology) domain-containing protein
MLDYDIENELRPLLTSGEKLTWTGKPKKGILLRGSDAFLIPFSLLWCGFAIFWESTVVFTNAPFFFKLWGIPFVAIGLYITIGRFFIDAKKRAGTVYGLTEDRVIIKSGLISKDVKSFYIKALPNISYSQKADGSGTITLGTQDPRYAMMQGMEWPGVKQPPRLELIEDVKTVYDKLIAIQRQR